MCHACFQIMITFSKHAFEYLVIMKCLLSNNGYIGHACLKSIVTFGIHALKILLDLA